MVGKWEVGIKNTYFLVGIPTRSVTGRYTDLRSVYRPFGRYLVGKSCNWSVFVRFSIFGAKNRLCSPRARPLGGTNGNQDTLRVGARPRVGYQNLVHIVQSQREKIALLGHILGGFTVEELGKFQLLPLYKIRRNYFLNKKLRVRCSKPMYRWTSRFVSQH